MIQAKRVCLPLVVAMTLLIALALASCASQPPAPAGPTTAPPAATNAPPAATKAPPPPAATSTTAPEQSTAEPQATATTVVASPTAAPSATPTITPTATPRKAGAPPKPTSSGALTFTIEFGQSKPREGDRKVQMTVILHIAGGAPPYQALEDNIPQTVAKTLDGIEYTRDWADCSPAQPHTITVVSADGQRVSRATMIPYKCP
jgi:hypothetical protein